MAAKISVLGLIMCSYPYERVQPVGLISLSCSVRRVALTRLYTRLTAAAGDPPDTNIVLAEY